MERTSAACAMEWSIELDKGLRSKRPGQSVEAILQIGPRLEQWNREPVLTIAEYNLFGLVPGEERLFANAILLRLADAFSSGDKHTKLCVVKVLLSELRHRKKRTEPTYGILSKSSLENHVELLRRVKIVFDTGDFESRALALVLFGCWADFAKDSAEIQYLILSSLVSSHVLEVEASLFAAGCFSELSDDFAFVLLEILVNMLTSSETLPTVRLAGVRVFAKMGCSSSLAKKAYKAGFKLVVDSSEEDFLVVMLISLSKLASKMMFLISGQVDLLFSFLTQGKTLRLQATALRCLCFVLVRGMCHFPASADSIKTLLNMLNESKFPPALQYGALQIVHEILFYNLPTIPCVDMLEFPELLSIVENATHSLIMAKRLLAIRVLVDISGKLVGRTEMALHGVTSIILASRVISLVIERITLLVKPALDLCQLDSEMEQECHSLLSLLLLLVEEHPDLVLDKICLFIEYLVNMHDRVIGTGQPELSGHEIVEFEGENSKTITSKLLLHISRIVVACLEKLNEAGAFTTQVLSAVKLLVEHIHQCSLFDCYTDTVYSLLLHSHITCYCMPEEMEENNNLGRNFCVSLHVYSLQHEILTLECGKKMLARKDNWSAYRAGKYAACQGAWFTAAFIFGHLTTAVQSNSCYFWLESLAQFAHSERIVQLLLLPEQGSILVNWLEIEKISVVPLKNDFGKTGQGCSWKINSPTYIENLVEACNLSEKAVGATIKAGHAFCFQRWFLALRVKVLESVVDILKLLGSLPLTQDNVSNGGQIEGIIMDDSLRLKGTTSLVYSLTQISFRLKRLAQEYDLIATSFIGMDSKSLKIISSLALSCSLLAFSTGFSLFIPNLHAKNFRICGLENSVCCLHAMLIQDLLGRLWHIDCETSTKLWLLLKICGQFKSSFISQSRNQILTGYEARGIFAVCSYAVTGVVGLQNEANRLHDDEILSQVTNDGLQLLLDITTKWMHIPFRTPNHFFRVRPCISSELFALTGDSGTPDGIFILQGFHLSLNLCLQLKNVSPDLPVRLTKLYCILYCRTSFQINFQSGENKGQMQLDCQDWGADDMVDLNEKLLQYVTGCTETTQGMRDGDNTGDCEVVDACVCFEPNERGQGFSNCVLDVSAFPVGSYRIKWHSCCMDDKGSYWSLLPLNAGPVFTVRKSSVFG
uniref:Integrator complex subunit 7 n=1 Tax=Davidia involucrata TaxID=16924 RepID=A0A5B6ZPJ9_DAVIN